MADFWSRVGSRPIPSLVVTDPEWKPRPRPPLSPLAQMVYDLQMDMIRRVLAAGGG